MPDLFPCDFFLWGHLKAVVFKTRPTSLSELKAAIITAVKEIPMGMINRVIDYFRDHLQKCVLFGGGYLKDVIFKVLNRFIVYSVHAVVFLFLFR